VSTSVVYRTATAYALLMRALYGRHYGARLRAVAEQVPVGSTVLELCCGPGTLYLRALRQRTTAYTGLDVNQRFVARLRRRGVDARLVDVSGGPLPPADVVVMHASLYHFLPHAGEVVDRMLAAARERVIVCEPVRNLASSGVPLIGSLARRAADPGVGGHAQRFTERTLDELMAGRGERVLAAFPIPGGREKLYVLAAARAGLPARGCP